MKAVPWFLMCVSALWWQISQAQEMKGILYEHEMSGGVVVHTSGWGIFLDIAREDDYRRKSLFQFEFTQLRHPKEVKQTIDFGLTIFGFNSPRPFIYGKQNNLYCMNASYGKQFMLAEKAEKAGVEVGLKVLGGISLGLQKPYYLNLLYPTDNSQSYEVRAVRYTEETAEKFLDWFSIYGGAGPFYGFGEIKFIPGIHLKSGLNFDWAQLDHAIKALEVGAILDVYYKEVPIMILEKNAQFYPNLYLSIQFGKKW